MGLHGRRQNTAFHGDVVVGADGFESVVRRFMVRALREEDHVCAHAATERLGVECRAMTFPTDARQYHYCMRADAVHVWPRLGHCITAVADKATPTFTGTLFVRSLQSDPETPRFTTNHGGDAPPPPPSTSLSESKKKNEASPSPTTGPLSDPMTIATSMSIHYPDVLDLVPNAAEQLHVDTQRRVSHRQARLGVAVLRVSHWHYRGRMVVIGSAAHGLHAFPFGTDGGVDVCLESVFHFAAHLRLQGDVSGLSASERQARVAKGFAAFQTAFQPNATAIGKMAIGRLDRLLTPSTAQSTNIEEDLAIRFPTRFRSMHYLLTQTITPFQDVYRMRTATDGCVAAVALLLNDHGCTSVDAYTRTVGNPTALAALTGLVDRWLTTPRADVPRRAPTDDDDAPPSSMSPSAPVRTMTAKL